MTFTQRKIDLTFQIGEGTQGLGSYQTIKVTGLRVRAQISNVVGPAASQALVRVWGLPLQLMNQLSISIPMFNGRFATKWTNLIIDAGDALTGMSTVFQGNIMLAPINLNSMPESFLEIVAQPGAFAGVQSTSASSFPAGSADAADILRNLAGQAGLAFENNGVSVVLHNPYYRGTVREQIDAVAKHANINYYIDSTTNTLVLWPQDGYRSNAVHIISADTGMIGYPTNWNIGVEVRTVFNKSMRLGDKVQIKSQLAFANGYFNAYDITHELESEMPGGKWQTSFHGVWLNA